MSNYVKVMARNQLGRDFVVGDIHGCFDQVERAMARVGFDPACDRLFCVGDLVDRGPHSDRALEFIGRPYVHAVRGNHEDMILEFYRELGAHQDRSIVLAVGGRNGMQWWAEVSPERKTAYAQALAELPIAIEVATDRGTVGIVHADVPRGMDWPAFLDALRAGDPAAVKTALWGRSRIREEAETGVHGVGRVFVGHTIQERPRRFGNVYAVDTGAYLSLFDDDPPRVTIASLCFDTGLIDRGAALDQDAQRPFGEFDAGPGGP